MLWGLGIKNITLRNLESTELCLNLISVMTVKWYDKPSLAVSVWNSYYEYS